MGRLSSKLTTITFGTVNMPAATTPPQIARCAVSLVPASMGAVTDPGKDGGNGLYANCEFTASRVWNSVWNDVADFQLLCDRLEFGKCYFDTKDGARICNQRCQMSVIGIASDTFGYGVGQGANPASEVPIAIAGWVLAFVDQEYECGTPLTNDEFGNLTAMTRAEKLEYPERIVALYKRKEMDEQWGPAHQKIEVKGRHWVKVK